MPMETPHSPPVATFSVPQPHLQTAWDQHVHNASTRHPVFFTERLRRPHVEMGTAPGFNPVAHGYVYRDSGRVGNDAGNNIPPWFGSGLFKQIRRWTSAHIYDWMTHW
ncbi:hypothetical protein SODALDRAFT_353960 [Sodiomyces alkalinus F11]|uniref:Uncharacterized protein n=1 Tax=Sodiomyces alkalinus (strain CBS 110278 / VKM F-3762 / F11) TaxID=1314773 RepID=A0A3N2Q5B0_SODAK|nr:hypothetical protein SODALDRAFT_353960 [Sodiomyces alkalinus F11]ROT41838.1 hypothetical protein SODALDRAFT_353960 [Sodiomyces alkalinus F11]